MTEPFRPSTAALGGGTAASAGATDRRIRRSWWIFAASLLVLGVIVIVRLGTEGASLLDWIVIGLLGLAGAAGLVNRQAVSALETGLRAEAESFARILSGLSRTLSPDAILGAIVDELARATDADHIVVVRRRPDARVLEATLISSRPGVPNATTLLPIGDLEDAASEVEVGAERVPTRVGVMGGRRTTGAEWAPSTAEVMAGAGRRLRRARHNGCREAAGYHGRARHNGCREAAGPHGHGRLGAAVGRSDGIRSDGWGGGVGSRARLRLPQCGRLHFAGRSSSGGTACGRPDRRPRSDACSVCDGRWRRRCRQGMG